MTLPILSLESLSAAVRARVLLASLLGDYRPSQALRLARLVWEQAPVLFPDFAAALVEGDTRAACWDVSQLVADLPGTWDIATEARRIAAS